MKQLLTLMTPPHLKVDQCLGALFESRVTLCKQGSVRNKKGFDVFTQREGPEYKFEVRGKADAGMANDSQEYITHGQRLSNTVGSG